MPLIRRDGPATPASPPADIASANTDERWRAARELGKQPGAVAALGKALAAETDPRVREAILTSLIRIGTSESAGALARHVRSADAGLRSGAIEALQAMPKAAVGVLPDLVADDDPDVRVRAVEIARSIEPADATALLVPILRSDSEPNVCAAAIDVLAENGTADALPALQACGDRFARHPFLPFAARVAIERLAGAG